MGYIERNIVTTSDLMPALDTEWNALKRLVEQSRDADLTGKTDAAGWSSKDHLAHLATWAHSVVRMVREGTPRWEGLGISKAVYETPGWDEKNEIIRQATRDLPLDEVMRRLEDIQRDIVGIVEGMSDEELNRSLADFAEGGEGESLIRRIVGTFPDHYEEHRIYIEYILAYDHPVPGGRTTISHTVSTSPSTRNRTSVPAKANP